MLRRSRLVFQGGGGGGDLYTGGLPNLTAALNARGNAEDRGKWTDPDPKRQRGIPRRSRQAMSSIKTLHESSALIVMGRNRCNNFNSNQYLLVSKDTNEGIFVDFADDWADDWVGFVTEAGIDVRFVFLTHLHIDNIIGLAPFHRMMPHVRIAWNLADRYWLEKFPAACRRYCREDMVHADLPMTTLSLGPIPRNAAFLHGEEDRQREGKSSCGGASPSSYRSTPNLNLFLSGSTTRSSSFIEFGSLSLFYIASPGHSMGHMMLHIPQEKLLFSGDLIGYDWIGRTDLPMALGSLMGQSLRMLEGFPDHTVLMPGHGRLTTMGRERKCNKGLQRLYELIAAGKPIPSVGFGDGTL